MKIVDIYSLVIKNDDPKYQNIIFKVTQIIRTFSQIE